MLPTLQKVSSPCLVKVIDNLAKFELLIDCFGCAQSAHIYQVRPRRIKDEVATLLRENLVSSVDITVKTLFKLKKTKSSFTKVKLLNGYDL